MRTDLILDRAQIRRDVERVRMTACGPLGVIASTQDNPSKGVFLADTPIDPIFGVTRSEDRVDLDC